MAFPKIQVANRGTSDDEYSGAGPATALTGTAARTRNYSVSIMGLFDNPDLSAVDVDGSDALYVYFASGRRLYSITGKKTTNQSTTATGTSGNNYFDVASATGMAIGDVIKVVGGAAAGADYYSLISNVSGLTITCQDALGSSVSGAACQDPPYVTMGQSIPGMTADAVWGIGGIRQTLARFEDLLPGWSMEIDGSGASAIYRETAYTLTVAGSASDGKIKITGINNPRLRGDGSSPAFTVEADLWEFDGIDFDTVTSPITIASSNCKDIVARNLMCFSQTGTYYGIRVTSATTSGRLRVISCLFGGETGSGAKAISIEGALDDLSVENSFFIDLTTANLTGIDVTTATRVTCRECVFEHGLTGIALGSATGTARGGSHIERCMFLTPNYGGITVGHIERVKGLIVRGCHFYQCTTYGLSLPANSQAYAAELDWNNFYSSPRGNCSAGPHDTSEALSFNYRTDTLTDYAGFDYTLTIGWESEGWPSSLPGIATGNYIDSGVATRKPTARGSTRVRITDAIDQGADWDFKYEVLTGSRTGASGVFTVPKNSIPADDTPLDAAGIGPLTAALRDQSAVSLTGREIGA